LSKKQILSLLAMVVLCYIAAFFKLLFIFSMLFPVLCYAGLFFLGAAIYIRVLPQDVRKKYANHQIRFRLILAAIMILFLVGRWIINDCYMHEAHYMVRMPTKALLLIAIFFLGRSFLIKGWTRTISACFIICCLFILFPAFRNSIKFESGQLNPQDNVKALQTLGYAEWTPLKAEPDKSAVTVYDQQACYKGINIYSSRAVTYLVDMKGNILHTWNLNQNDDYTGFYRVELLENGDLLAIIGHGKGFIKLGWDSRIIWETDIYGHHDLYVKPNGDIYVLASKSDIVFFAGLPLPIRDDHIVVLTPDGQIKNKIPLYPPFKRHLRLRDVIGIYTQMIKPDNLVKIVSHKLSGKQLLEKISAVWFSHANTVEVIDRDIDAVCKKGDILVSSRDMSLIGILDVEKSRFVWTWGPGVISGQHQPTLLPNGNIMLLDNGWRKRNYSRVIELDPATKKIEWEYKANPKQSFFTSGRGGNQRLPNGNTLVTDTCSGRVFEITKNGETVWEFYNPNLREKTQERATIYRMTRITDTQNYPILHQFNAQP